MSSNHSENCVNKDIDCSYESKVLDKGAYLPEDRSKIEEQNKSCDSIESSDTSHGRHVSCGKPSLSEIGTQPIASLHTNAVQEGPEPITCDAKISLTQRNDDIAGISDVLEDDESLEAYIKKRRLERKKLSEPPTADLEVTKLASGSSLSGWACRRESNMDCPVESESGTPSCSHGMSKKRMNSEDRISVEVVKGKLLEEASECHPESQNTLSNIDEKVLIDKSNGNTSENCDSDMLTLAVSECRTESDIQCNKVSTETDNYEFPRVYLDDALGRDISQHNERQFVASEVDPSLKQLGCSEGVSSQAVKECTNVAVSRDLAGSSGKKLLVLDMNGLLVDISSYVPYDYDPDDIIERKAVFKRPYCDDFLEFCFQRFNVGVWTSRTKRNMDPILDFLLGSNKSRLLFYWDQSHCTDTGYYTVEKRNKPLLLKKLKKLWDKYDPNLPWERGVYNESNTLLLDDTPYKALCNPQYTAIFPLTYRFRHVRDNSLGPGGDLCVYLEGLAAAENVQEYVKQNPFGQRPITEKNLSWGYYLNVINDSTSPPRQTDEESQH